MFEPRLKVLPQAQRALWPELGALAGESFVLYGGTAIALYLGHRVSVDFDFFSPFPLHRERIFQVVPVLRFAQIIQDQVDALTMLVTVPGQTLGVKVSFFGSIGMGRVGTPLKTNDEVMIVASKADLLATKLKTILQRAESKDYLDIYALLDDGANLTLGLAHARALFGLAFQPAASLKALSYFGDGDLNGLNSGVKKALSEAASKVSDLPVSAKLSQAITLA